ncbi:MAG: hypothetical protein PHO15_01230 [Eubacteriales bacterium]|nr:hypothetical protein [Eubacteriales bacterium]
MKKHTKKLIAPVVITAILVLYLCALVVTWAYIPVSLAVKIIGAVIALALIGVSLYVLIQRIKEIRSGEEDDLSQY